MKPEPTATPAEYIKAYIRTVPDWPAPGVQFRDITPLLQDPRVFRVLIDAFVHRYMDAGLRPDVVAGLDARGFILGSVVAYELGLGFVPIRKKGKLPFTTVEPLNSTASLTRFFHRRSERGLAKPIGPPPANCRSDFPQENTARAPRL